MKIQLATKPLSEVKTEFLVLPVFEEEKSPFNGLVAEFLTDNPKFGKLFESQLLYSKSRKILLLGVGKREKFNFITLQNWAGAAVMALNKKTKEATLFMPQDENMSPFDSGKAVAIGSEIASHDPSKQFKSDHQPNKLVSLEVVVKRADKGYQDGIKIGEIIAEGIILAKTLGDLPANIMTPTYFLDIAKKVAKEGRLKIKIIDEKQAKKMGMGAFVGVAQGSDEPSFMIALELKGDIKSKEKWGIIGKGITFDTGGISIKPSEGMSDMKYDMCGAAAVLGTMLVLAKLKVKANVVGVMAVTENLPGGKAQRPGDIVKTYSGKSAEVLNTDAEGRLVLVDAITFAQKDFKATKLIDLATLTGAIIIALGDFYTGAFGNNPKFTQELITKGAKVGEKIWEMPMDEDYDFMIESKFADITNIGHSGSHSKAAGSITGAKFIGFVVENNRPWVHLDIGGTADDSKPRPFRGAGATGVGVKTLVEIITA